MTRAIEYQVSELKTMWEQFPNILWINGLGGYVRLGNQNICRITLRKSEVDKYWNDSAFLNKDYNSKKLRGDDNQQYDSNLYNEYVSNFEYYYIGYEYQVISLITGKEVSKFYHTWDGKLYCGTLAWEEPPKIEDMLKSVAKHYEWIEVWCK